MIEDVEALVASDKQQHYNFAVSYGLEPGEMLPESQDDLTPAQDVTYLLARTLEAHQDAALRARMDAEMRSKIVVPENMN